MTLLTALILATSNVRTAAVPLVVGGYMPIIENEHLCGEWRLLISWDDVSLPTAAEANAHAQRLIDWAKAEHAKGPGVGFEPKTAESR